MSTTHLQTVLASVATTRYHWGGGPQVNKFEQVSIVGHPGGGSLYSEVASWVMATWGPFCGQTKWQSHMTENITLTLTPLASGNKLCLEILDWYRNCFLSKWSLSVISPQKLLHHHSPGDHTFEKLNFPFWGPSGSNSSSKLKYI